MIKEGQVRRLALNPERWLFEGQVGLGLGSFIEFAAPLQLGFGDQILIGKDVYPRYDEDFLDDPVEIYYRDGKVAVATRAWLETFTVEIG